MQDFEWVGPVGATWWVHGETCGFTCGRFISVCMGLCVERLLLWKGFRKTGLELMCGTCGETCGLTCGRGFAIGFARRCRERGERGEKKGIFCVSEKPSPADFAPFSIIS